MNAELFDNGQASYDNWSRENVYQLIRLNGNAVSDGKNDPVSTRGAKTQNIPGSNFLRAKTFRTVSHNKPKKRMVASYNIAKECVINVLGL